MQPEGPAGWEAMVQLAPPPLPRFCLGPHPHPTAAHPDTSELGVWGIAQVLREHSRTKCGRVSSKSHPVFGVRWPKAGRAALPRLAPRNTTSLLSPSVTAPGLWLLGPGEEGGAGGVGWGGAGQWLLPEDRLSR